MSGLPEMPRSLGADPAFRRRDAVNDHAPRCGTSPPGAQRATRAVFDTFGIRYGHPEFSRHTASIELGKRVQMVDARSAT